MLINYKPTKKTKGNNQQTGNNKPKLTEKKHSKFGNSDIQQPLAPPQLPIPLPQDMQVQQITPYNPKTPLPEPKQGVKRTDVMSHLQNQLPPQINTRDKDKEVKSPPEEIGKNMDIASAILARKEKENEKKNAPQQPQQFNNSQPTFTQPIPPIGATSPFDFNNPQDMPPGMQPAPPMGLPPNMQPPPNIPGGYPPNNDMNLDDEDFLPPPEKKQNRRHRQTDSLFKAPLFAPVPGNYPESDYLNSFEKSGSNENPTPPGKPADLPPPPSQSLYPQEPINNPMINQGNIPNNQTMPTQPQPSDPAALGLNPAYFNNTSQFVQASVVSAKKTIAAALITAGAATTVAAGFLMGKSKQLGSRENMETCRSIAGEYLESTTATFSIAADYLKNSFDRLTGGKVFNFIKNMLKLPKRGSAEYLKIRRKTELTDPKEVGLYLDYISRGSCNAGKNISLQFAEENYASGVLNNFLSNNLNYVGANVGKHFNFSPSEKAEVQGLIDNILNNFRGQIADISLSSIKLSHLEKAISKSQESEVIEGSLGFTTDMLEQLIEGNPNKDSIIENIGKLRAKLSTSNLRFSELGSDAKAEARKCKDRIHDIKTCVNDTIAIVKRSKHDPERIPTIKIVLDNHNNEEILKNLIRETDGSIPKCIEPCMLGGLGRESELFKDISKVNLEYENVGWLKQMTGRKHEENSIRVKINGCDFLIGRNP